MGRVGTIVGCKIRDSSNDLPFLLLQILANAWLVHLPHSYSAGAKAFHKIQGSAKKDRQGGGSLRSKAASRAEGASGRRLANLLPHEERGGDGGLRHRRRKRADRQQGVRNRGEADHWRRRGRMPRASSSEKGSRGEEFRGFVNNLFW